MATPVAPSNLQDSPVDFVPNTSGLSGAYHQIVAAPASDTAAPPTQQNENSGYST